MQQLLSKQSLNTEPPQPEQFKAGDWVVADDYETPLLKRGKPYQVAEVKGIELFLWTHDGDDTPYSYMADYFRRATPAEIRREWCRVMDWDAEMVSRCIVDDPPTDIAEESEQLKAALSIAQINESQPVPDADGWIPWDKGYCPPGLHDELIEVRTTASGNLGERPAKVTYWGNSKLRPEDNITHYRLLHSPQPVTDWVEVVTR